jgi:hypothetical protein
MSNSIVKEVLFPIAHFNSANSGEEPKIKIDDYFKSTLKECGFKWLSINNSESGLRETNFVYKSKDATEVPTENKEELVRLNTGQIMVAQTYWSHTVIASDVEIECKSLPKRRHLFEVGGKPFDASLGEFRILSEFNGEENKEEFIAKTEKGMRFEYNKGVHFQVLVVFFLLENDSIRGLQPCRLKGFGKSAVKFQIGKSIRQSELYGEEDDWNGNGKTGRSEVFENSQVHDKRKTCGMRQDRPSTSSFKSSRKK